MDYYPAENMKAINLVRGTLDITFSDVLSAYSKKTKKQKKQTILIT